MARPSKGRAPIDLSKPPSMAEDPIAYLEFGMDFTSTAGEKPKKQVHPNSLAALAANRHRRNFGNNPHICSKCRRVAVRGLDVCYFHGGYRVTKQRRLEKGKPIKERSRHAMQKVIAMQSNGALPRELLVAEPFVAVQSTLDTLRKQGEATTNGEIQYRRALRLLLYKLVLGWFKAQAGDPAMWTDAVRETKALGLT